jgi:hypothetical protein
MRVWYRGFTIRSKSFLENGKLNRFIVARIYSRKHLTNMRTAGKKVKEIKMGRGSNISAMNSFEEEWCPICRIQPFKYGY